MTLNVLASQNEAITVARKATTARVLSLELLAAHVAAAETARRDWGTARKMAANNDKYIDLVARTAANEQATREITGIAEQVFQAAQAVRETLQQACPGRRSPRTAPTPPVVASVVIRVWDRVVASRRSGPVPSRDPPHGPGTPATALF